MRKVKRYLTWDNIKDSFPGIHSPEEAIKRTVKRCISMGLISLAKTKPLTDSQIESVRQRGNRERKREAAL